MAELKPVETRAKTIRDLMEQIKPRLAAVLPKQLPPEAFNEIAWTTIRQNPALLECRPDSLIGAMLQAANLRLRLDGVLGHAFLIPRRIKGTLEALFQIGYKGLMELALRSGKVVAFETATVKEKDRFEFEYGSKGYLRHRPPLDGPRGEPIAFYALARLRDGQTVFKVLSRTEVEEVRDRFADSWKYNREQSPWTHHFEAMAEKTVAIRLCDRLPLRPEEQTIVQLEKLAEAGLSQGLDALFAPEAPPSKMDALEATMRTHRSAAPTNPTPAPESQTTTSLEAQGVAEAQPQDGDRAQPTAAMTRCPRAECGEEMAPDELPAHNAVKHPPQAPARRRQPARAPTAAPSPETPAPADRAAMLREITAENVFELVAGAETAEALAALEDRIYRPESFYHRLPVETRKRIIQQLHVARARVSAPAVP